MPASFVAVAVVIVARTLLYTITTAFLRTTATSSLNLHTAMHFESKDISFTLKANKLVFNTAMAKCALMVAKQIAGN